MKPAALLILLFSTGGHWFSGDEGTITVRTALDANAAKLPESVLAWDLMWDGVRLGGQVVPLRTGDDGTTVTFLAPPVRMPTTLRWTYRVVTKDGARELERGSSPVRIYPKNLIDDFSRRLNGRNLAVVDPADGLPRILEGKAPHQRFDDVGGLRTAAADIVLVGPGRLDDSPFAQAPLLALAASGASVMLFEQSRPGDLATFRLMLRAPPRDMIWRLDHPLLTGLSSADARGLLRGVTRDVRAVQLPPDADALELAWWPRETPSVAPAPLDALIVVRAVGNGRIVLFQLPLGPWGRDPRSQLVLNDALSYLLTRPEPTPRPSERPPTRPAPAELPAGRSIRFP